MSPAEGVQWLAARVAKQEVELKDRNAEIKKLKNQVKKAAKKKS